MVAAVAAAGNRSRNQAAPPRGLARQRSTAHHAAMSESPYAMPLQEFEARMRVDRGGGQLPLGDGGAGGGCD